MSDPLTTPVGDGIGDVPAGRDRGAVADGSRSGRRVRLISTGVASAVLLWFAFGNLQRVHIQFWLASASAPLIVVVVVSGFLGAAVSALLSRVVRRRRRNAPVR